MNARHSSEDNASSAPENENRLEMAGDNGPESREGPVAGSGAGDGPVPPGKSGTDAAGSPEMVGPDQAGPDQAAHESGARGRKLAEKLSEKLARSQARLEEKPVVRPANAPGDGDPFGDALRQENARSTSTRRKGPRVSAVTGLEKKEDNRRPLERNLTPYEDDDQPENLTQEDRRPGLVSHAAEILFWPFRMVLATGLAGFFFVLSLAWILAALYWLDKSFGAENALQMLPHELGMFVAGATAPLILVWFGFAWVKQSRALTAQLRALNRTAEQTNFQAETMSLTERHLRLDSVLNLSEFYLSQMSKEAAILATHTFRLNRQQEENLWTRFAQGDREIFFRLFFEKAGGDLADRIAKVIVDSDLASKSAHLFSGHYQVFVRHAESIDRGNLMLEAYKQGYLGDLSRVVNKALYGMENPFS